MDMSYEQPIINDLRNVDITDDFMFSYVMRKPEICIEMLEYLLPGQKIRTVKYIQMDNDEIEADASQPETQKSLNEAFAKRVGKDRSLRTYQKYLTVRKYLAEFIKVHYKRTDIAMNELTEDFIRDYCLYLRNEVGLAQSSVWIYSIPLKHIVTTAHYNGKIARNPFAQYKVDPDHKERGFLTEEELQTFTTVELNNPDLELARDLFVFGCWTGISFIDIKNLTTENISMLGGSPWIVSKRQKTGVPFQIKLMDIPMQIIKRYEPYRIGYNLFNIGSHDVINSRIKEVAKICGIEKRTSFHLSRHTFAVLALNYGMPIESVSKILGHTNITI